jgi:hypothetical protein
MENQGVLEKGLGQIGFLTRIILRFYTENKLNFVKASKITAVSVAVTIGINVNILHIRKYHVRVYINGCYV